MKKLFTILALAILAGAAWAGSGWDIVSQTTNADSLQHKIPDFGVDLLADSLAVKAPLASPTFTGLVTVDSLKGKVLKVITLAGDSITLADANGSPTIEFRNAGISGTIQFYPDGTFGVNKKTYIRGLYPFDPSAFDCGDLTYPWKRSVADTVKAVGGLVVGGGDALTKIYMQNDSLYLNLSDGSKLQMKPTIIPAP